MTAFKPRMTIRLITEDPNTAPPVPSFYRTFHAYAQTSEFAVDWETGWPLWVKNGLLYANMVAMVAKAADSKLNYEPSAVIASREQDGVWVKDQPGVVFFFSHDDYPGVTYPVGMSKP